MLEIVNSFLLVYFTALSALCSFAPLLAKYLHSSLFKASTTEQELRKTILELKNEQRHLSMKDEFAAFSRLQRKINKLEAEASDLQSTRKAKALALKTTASYGLQAVIGLITMISLIFYRQEPLVILKSDTYPIGPFLSFPTDIPNAVSVHVWALISNYSMRILFRPIIS